MTRFEQAATTSHTNKGLATQLGTQMRASFRLPGPENEKIRAALDALAERLQEKPLR